MRAEVRFEHGKSAEVSMETCLESCFQKQNFEEKEQRFVTEHGEGTEAVHKACKRSVFRNFFVEREQRFVFEHG